MVSRCRQILSGVDDSVSRTFPGYALDFVFQALVPDQVVQVTRWLKNKWYFY